MEENPSLSPRCQRGEDFSCERAAILLARVEAVMQTAE